MKSSVFISKYVIRETYLDTFGHMNNAKYLSLFEEARWDWITQNGFGMKEMQSLALGPTILEINIRFLRELKARDEVEIESQVISYVGKIGKIQQRILKNKIVYCEATLTVGLFDLKTRKLIQPTKEWLLGVGIVKE